MTGQENILVFAFIFWISRVCVFERERTKGSFIYKGDKIENQFSVSSSPTQQTEKYAKQIITNHIQENMCVREKVMNGEVYIERENK